MTFPPTRRARAARQLVAALALAVLAVLLLVPAPASAHAVLTGSTPAEGEALDAAPERVEVTFNEPVATTETSLRVFDGDGVRVDDGGLEAGEAAAVAVPLPADLDDGAYVAAYRVVSADSHPIAGTITFTVGDAQALDAATVDAVAGIDAGAIGIAGSLLRGAGYAGTLVAAGAVVFTAVVGRRDADRRRAARLARPAALLGAVAVLLHVPVQAAAVSGFGVLAAATDAGALGSTLTSGFGQSAILRLVALVALALLWSRPVPAWTRWAASGAALGSFLLDGHQRTAEPAWLLVGGDAVHLAGAATWAAGLVLLVATLRADRRDDDPVEAATVVTRFSRLALWSVLALAVAGTAMSLPLVRGFGALVSTTYGWTLLAKVGLVAVIVAVAAYNRRQLVPRVAAGVVPAGASVDVAPADLDARDRASAAAWSTLTTTVRVEAALLAAVLLLTGFLVSTQPAAEAAGLSGATYVSAPFGDELELDLTVDPSTPGVNTIHVFTLEPSGQPSDEVGDLRLEFTYLPEQIGPIVVEPFVAGPGHWTASISDLRFAGPWEVRVVGGIGRFDEAETTIDFQIND